MEKTTIQLNSQTLERLKAIKQIERQSYDNLVNNLIDTFEEEELSSEEIQDIQEGLEDIKQGRVYPLDEVAKELGIRLD